MKQPTINQINGRIKNSPTINFYVTLNQERESYAIPYKERNYRSREYNFVRTFADGTREKARLSLTGNFIYGQAMREFKRIMNLPNQYDYQATHRSGHIDMIFQGTNYREYGLSLQADPETGVTLQVQTHTPSGTSFKRYTVKSNCTFAGLDIKAYFEAKILPVLMFAPGLFRNIQLVYNLQKSEVAAKYNQLRQQWKAASAYDPEPEEIQNKALCRRLQKKLNIKPDMFVNNKGLLQALKTYTRQPRPIELRPLPTPFELLEQLSNEYDDEEELLNAANEIINDNTVLYI